MPAARADEVAARLEKRGMKQFGDRNGMTPALAEQILRAAV